MCSQTPLAFGESGTMGCIIVMIMIGSALSADQVGLIRRFGRHLLLNPSGLVYVVSLADAGSFGGSQECLLETTMICFFMT